MTLPDRPGDNAGTAPGVDARLWLGRLGVGVLLAQARAEVPLVTPPGGPVGPTPIRVSLVAAQVLYSVLEGPAARIWVTAGGGAAHHGGVALRLGGDAD